jgi:DNA helicase HerA-like ATPase
MGLKPGIGNSSINAGSLNTNPHEGSVGVIFGTISTTQFKFAIAEKRVHRTGYTQIWHPDHGWILGQIMELNYESNLSYSKAQEISSEQLLKSWMNTDTGPQLGHENRGLVDGKLSGLVNIIGYRDRNNIVQLPSSPLTAGQPVYPASENLLASVLGLDMTASKGAYIGLLRNHDYKVNLDINQLVQKHISVIAKTGSGKSYIVGILVEEMIKRKLPTIIIDPHGEYSSLMHPNIDEHDTRLMSKYKIRPRGYPDSIREYSLNPSVNLGSIPIKLSNSNFTPDSVAELLGLRGSGVQTTILYRALNKLSAQKNFFTLKDLSMMVELDRNGSKWHLINSIENLLASNIFSDTPTRLPDLVQPGRVSIVNLRGATPYQQQIVVTQLTRQLFEARKLNKIPAVLLVIEEAHQFCPQQGRVTSSNVLRTIASEGRKFGLGLCVVSQRPAMVDKNVLSQCNTQVILKVTNPNDLKAIIASVEGLTTSMIDEIQRLPVSVGIVIGGGIQVPIFVDVRVRETKHGGRPVDIFSNVDAFHSGPTTDDYEESIDVFEPMDELTRKSQYDTPVESESFDNSGPAPGTSSISKRFNDLLKNAKADKTDEIPSFDTMGDNPEGVDFKVDDVKYDDVVNDDSTDNEVEDDDVRDIVAKYRKNIDPDYDE